MSSRSKATAARAAGDDLWSRTLSQIPSVFGRMVYLASLRNPNTGGYEHYGFAAHFGPEEANRALRHSHNASCREWLRLAMKEQKTDLDLYFSAQDGGPAAIAANWLELGFWKTILPESIRGGERELYLANAEALLTLLRKADAGFEAGSASLRPLLPGQ